MTVNYSNGKDVYLSVNLVERKALAGSESLILFIRCYLEFWVGCSIVCAYSLK